MSSGNARIQDKFMQTICNILQYSVKIFENLQKFSKILHERPRGNTSLYWLSYKQAQLLGFFSCSASPTSLSCIDHLLQYRVSFLNLHVSYCICEAIWIIFNRPIDCASQKRTVADHYRRMMMNLRRTMMNLYRRRTIYPQG